MNAVALLAASFATIAVVGTLLAVAHDLIAAAITQHRVTRETSGRTGPRTMSPAVLRSAVDRPPVRANAVAAAPRVRARRRCGAAAPGASA